ncbi:MAG: FG-GAP repeat protein [Planctomycetes bacterium]|nr:FG-GAP repeat protein [Planctomycetota bacterium]
MPTSPSILARLAVLAVVIAGSSAQARQTHLTEFLGAAGDRTGHALAPAGDVDGDGFPDLLVGAPRQTSVWGTPDGAAWIASGRHLATGAGPARLHTWSGSPFLPLGYALFGAALAGGADLDADGVPDAVVGSPKDAFLGPQGGSVSVFSGATGALLARFDGAAHQALGSAVVLAGDVNGDGWIDLLAGAPVYDSNFGTAYGHAHVYSGEWIARTAAGQTPLTPAELAVTYGSWNHGDFGTSLAPLGDLDGDGLADYAVGAPRGGAFGGGYVSVFRGTSTQPFVVIDGAASADCFGGSIAAVGDVDGDGLVDLAVGAWGTDVGTGNTLHGRVHLVRGAWLLQSGQGLPPSVSRDVWSRSGTAARDFFGSHVAGLGDLDADGVNEVAVGAPQSGFGLPSGLGYVDVLSGRTGERLFRAHGAQVDGQFGARSAGVGDLDLDGRPDLAVGAPYDTAGGLDAGRVVLLRGLPPVGTALCVTSATPNSSGAVARLTARGSASVSDAALFFELAGAPGGRPVVLFRGDTPSFAPFGDGVRCAGGQLLRAGAGLTSPAGAWLRPHALGAAAVGSTFVFQAWFDDMPAAGLGFNASDAVQLVVAP